MSALPHAGVDAGPAEELFLEFANTVELTDGRPVDHVPDARRLAAWLRVHRLVPARVPQADVERAMAEFRELRELVRAVVDRVASGREPTSAQMRRLNAVLRDGMHYEQVRRERGGMRVTVSRVGDAVDRARAAVAESLAHYLAHDDPARLRVCADDGCRWAFVDRSPAGRRRWCDMRVCGNRAKVARHRERARRAARAGGAEPKD